MKRGEVWTVSGGSEYAGKPRPAVIVQDDLFPETDSITICPFTSIEIDAAHFRLGVDPSPEKGLRTRSFIMVDKITTVPRQKLRTPVGRLKRGDLLALRRALSVFLGLANPYPPRPR